MLLSWSLKLQVSVVSSFFFTILPLAKSNLRRFVASFCVTFFSNFLIRAILVYTIFIDKNRF